MARKSTRLAGRQAIDRKRGGEPPHSTSDLSDVLSHIPCCLLAADGGADNLLTGYDGDLFRCAKRLNAWRKRSVTNTKAKGRQMTLLHGGRALRHLRRPS